MLCQDFVFPRNSSESERYSKTAGIELALGLHRVKMIDEVACDKVSPQSKPNVRNHLLGPS